MAEIVALVQTVETWRGCIRCPWTYDGPNAHAALMAHLAEAHPNWQSEDLPTRVPPVEPPEWGEPRAFLDSGEWYINARECKCGLRLGVVTSAGLTFAQHCPRHTFAHLVEGERRLREAADGQ